MHVFRLTGMVTCALGVVVLWVACGSNAGIVNSPLATWDPSKSDTFHQASSGEGTLEISAGCVRLRLKNQMSILLVWPEPTSWNASTQAIEFVSVLGERLALRDGDLIAAGGRIPRTQPDFVSAPDPSCEADEMFVLNSIRVVAN